MTPFEQAEHYIQLRKKFAPETWAETIMVINELFIGPLIALVYLFLGKSSKLSLLVTAYGTFNVWKTFIRYCDLKFVVQDMFLQTMASGGPRITTNDPMYMPYVYADAVYFKGTTSLEKG